MTEWRATWSRALSSSGIGCGQSCTTLPVVNSDSILHTESCCLERPTPLLAPVDRGGGVPA